MFSRRDDQRVQRYAKRLSSSLERRWAPDLLTDALYSLRYGQFDGFVSNVAAILFEGKERLNLFEAGLFQKLVDLMDMKRELDDLRDHIAKHPKRPEGPTRKLWA